MIIRCQNCRSTQLLFVAICNKGVVITCKECGFSDIQPLRIELKAAIRALMYPVDPWQGEDQEQQRADILQPGTRIEKCATDSPTDGHQDGAGGMVVSILGPFPEAPAELGIDHGYFVRWDDMPEMPVFVGATRIRRVSE